MSDQNTEQRLPLLPCSQCGYRLGEDWFGDRDFPPHDVACPECGYSVEQAEADLAAFMERL